ncbi:MAG: asparaginase domain-containing protein [Phycisphaerales bacterium]
MRTITLITTGGTLEKVYDETTGTLVNRHSNVAHILQGLRLEGTRINIRELMNKDSLDMTDVDRALIVDTVRKENDNPDVDGVLVLHGTDTLSETGDRLFADIDSPRVPIVLTGAMRPYELKQSDALQNLTESIFALGVLDPGVYAVVHGRALSFPGVVKDRTRGTFESGEHAAK